VRGAVLTDNVAVQNLEGPSKKEQRKQRRSVILYRRETHKKPEKRTAILQTGSACTSVGIEGTIGRVESLKKTEASGRKKDRQKTTGKALPGPSEVCWDAPI